MSDKTDRIFFFSRTLVSFVLGISVCSNGTHYFVVSPREIKCTICLSVLANLAKPWTQKASH